MLVVLFSFSLVSHELKWFGLVDYIWTVNDYQEITDLSVSVCAGDKKLNQIEFVPDLKKLEHKNKESRFYYTLYLHKEYMNDHRSWLERDNWEYDFFDIKKYSHEKNLIGFIHRGEFDCNNSHDRVKTLKNLRRFRRIEVAYRQFEKI